MSRITERHLIITRRNWMLFSVGLALIFLGFIVMRLDGEQYGFGFLGLTLGPLMLLAGFIVQIFAIMARPKAIDTTQVPAQGHAAEQTAVKASSTRPHTVVR